jgi:hypothetical protein
LVLLKFKVPFFPERYVYDKEEEDKDQEETKKCNYPPTVIIYGSQGIAVPCLLVYKPWEKETLLAPIQGEVYAPQPAKPIF